MVSVIPSQRPLWRHPLAQIWSLPAPKNQDTDSQTRGFKTVVHKSMGDVTVAPSTIYYAVYGQTTECSYSHCQCLVFCDAFK